MRKREMVPHAVTLVALAIGALVLYARAGPSTAGADGELVHPAAAGGRDARRAPGPLLPGFSWKVDSLRLRLRDVPDDLAALERLGRLWQDAHRPGEAVDPYRRYLALNPMNRQVWLDLANCYAALGEWEAAGEASEALLALYPGDPAAMYNAGAVQATLGRREEADRWWRRVEGQTRDPELAARARAALADLRSRTP